MKVFRGGKEVFLKEAETVSNGLINVPNIDIEYRGYHIVPKLDFGNTPYQSNGCVYRKGYVVTDGCCNVMPGATWFHSVSDAKSGINIYIESEGDGDKFWDLIHEANGLNEYLDV